MTFPDRPDDFPRVWAAPVLGRAARWCSPEVPTPEELERRIHHRTGRRVQGLTVDIQSGRIILRGRTSSYYLKQLAQNGVRDCCPDVPLLNGIEVVKPEGGLDVAWAS